MSVPLWGWVAVLGVILVMLAVDLVAHRKAHVVSVREAASWSAVWVALGLAFGRREHHAEGARRDPRSTTPLLDFQAGSHRRCRRRMGGDRGRSRSA